MERRINKKLEAYISEFKDNIKTKSTELGIHKNPSFTQFMQFIYDYDHLVLEKDDFMKRKRVKNVVVLSDRCCAKRASGEQCTRRKKEETEYCGTHLKGTPHGTYEVEDEIDAKPKGQKVEVWVQEIQGIIYYIDKVGNVYQVEDIIQSKTNPKVIAKYVKNGDIYTIPEFLLS
jgi:hypothetical protein